MFAVRHQTRLPSVVVLVVLASSSINFQLLVYAAGSFEYPSVLPGTAHRSAASR